MEVPGATDVVMRDCRPVRGGCGPFAIEVGLEVYPLRSNLTGWGGGGVVSERRLLWIGARRRHPQELGGPGTRRSSATRLACWSWRSSLAASARPAGSWGSRATASIGSRICTRRAGVRSDRGRRPRKPIERADRAVAPGAEPEEPGGGDHRAADPGADGGPAGRGAIRGWPTSWPRRGSGSRRPGCAACGCATI